LRASKPCRTRDNAYDADASLVEVAITDDTIEVRDNGSGMDMAGLKQYFNIGSQQKLHVPKSPVREGGGGVAPPHDRTALYGVD
jgi:hypothetical protein